MLLFVFDILWGLALLAALIATIPAASKIAPYLAALMLLNAALRAWRRHRPWRAEAAASAADRPTKRRSFWNRSKG